MKGMREYRRQCIRHQTGLTSLQQWQTKARSLDPPRRLRNPYGPSTSNLDGALQHLRHHATGRLQVLPQPARERRSSRNRCDPERRPPNADEQVRLLRGERLRSTEESTHRVCEQVSRIGVHARPEHDRGIPLTRHSRYHLPSSPMTSNAAPDNHLQTNPMPSGSSATWSTPSTHPTTSPKPPPCTPPYPTTSSSDNTSPSSSPNSPPT